jgi:uncharacterized membrane protein YkoI
MNRLLLLAFAFAAGRGNAKSSGVTMPIDKVPSNLIEVANKEVPGLKLENAYVVETDGKTVYEIRGTNTKGKIIEVEVDESGKVIAIE